MGPDSSLPGQSQAKKWLLSKLGGLWASVWCPKVYAPSWSCTEERHESKQRPSKQILLENSWSEFVKPIVKGLLKISLLYPALKFEPIPIGAVLPCHQEPLRDGGVTRTWV